MLNYIVDQNKFSLAGPPTWWLSKLWNFDASLVVVPSRQSCVYRLAQRRKLKLPEHIVNDALFNESDTKMLARYSLVPVTTIIATANWSNPFMFQELANRAPWMQGGAEKVVNRIEGQEAADETKRNMATDAHLTEVAKSGWKYFKKNLVK
jgi:hypothetical protein